MRIRSNVKGDINLNLESPYVLVHGRNGGGKSAVVHSVELACFGEVRDAAGRTMKQKGRVAHLASEDDLRAHVDFGGLSFEWPAGRKSYGMVNPLAITTDIMTASTDKLLVYLMENLEEDHEVKLDYANWDAVVKRHGQYRAALLEMYDNCGSCIRSYSKRIREHGVVQSWAQSLGETDQARAAGLLIEEDMETVRENKELLKDIKEKMANFIKGALPGLEDKMLRFMPDGMDAPKFVWLDNELRLGFEGRPVPSGVEMIALAIALAAVTVPDESDSRHVWVLPDRSYDPNTLGKIMRVLRGLFCRAVVIQSTILPEGYDFTDYGWELVEV